MAIQNKFPSIRPSLNLDFANTKTLDPRITFSRASTATYYDGKTVAKAEENLLLRSQEFDVWSKTFVTTQTNVGVAPDGTSTADLVYPSSTGTTRLIYRADTAANALIGTTAQKVFSVYAKASGKSWISFTDGSGTRYAHFNVSTGVVGTLAANHTASIVDVGGGWYRCVLSNSVAWGSPSAVCFGITDADNTNACTANGTDGVLFWGAQLEQRSSVTAYTPTTTLPITNYIPVLQTAAANVARFDHDPITGESLGLLIEEHRTNLLLRSQEFENASWTKSQASVTANTIVAPDGGLTGDKLVENTVTGLHYVEQAATTTSGLSYTGAVYLKAAERSWALVQLVGSAVFPAVFVNLLSGTIEPPTGSGIASILSVGNGWYRISLAGTTDTTSTRLRIYAASANNTTSYTGDGFSGIYIWGAQLEAGAFPTSYIKTEAAQATRSADAASMTGVNFSSWYRQDEGTLYSEFIPRGISVMDRTVVAIRDGGASDFVNSHTFRNYNGSRQIATHVNSVNQATVATGQVYVGAPCKVSYAYRVNDFAGSADGASASVDTSGLIPVVDRLTFPSTGCNHITKFVYYPARLSNAQLQALTA